MHDLRIDTDGLTIKEVAELEGLLNALDTVDEATFSPFLPGTVHRRSFPPQMVVGALHLFIRLSEAAGAGVSAAAGHHLYTKVGEGLVDKVWDAIKVKLSGRSSVEVAVTLYGPDGEVIKQHKGRR